jgi:ATPase subunit of ABC transporter with duplicated ATPase domains
MQTTGVQERRARGKTMIWTDQLSVTFGSRTLFDHVNIKFTPGNAYGLIGANGAGKSTFLKCLSGELDASSGSVNMPPGLRLSTLGQDHFKYNDIKVLDTVVQGHERLWNIGQEKDAIYAKPDFNDEDGIRAAELETEFADLDGWEAEAQASQLLEALNIRTADHQKLVGELTDNQKVRVLLAQALFGDPDVLLLDEPTNHLDVDSILWLEDFLLNFKNTVIVVSHDRHFLDKVCTHIADVDFQKVSLFTGNYTFWYETSQMALHQRSSANKKKEDKMKELKAFITRFSANASKSKQATSRKALLDKITLDDIKPSSRKYPYIVFKPERELGRDVLFVENITKSVNGQVVIKDLHFTMQKGERVALMGPSHILSAFMNMLSGIDTPDKGEIRWGHSANHGYMPKDHESFFDTDKDLVNWLRQYSHNQDESFVRGFLGRMLFTGDEVKKSASVLSGGEKMRCMFSRIMLRDPNFIILDNPTDHLDLESITALNKALDEFSGSMVFASDDTELVASLSTRILELNGDSWHDLQIPFEEYLKDEARLQRAGRLAA